VCSKMKFRIMRKRKRERNAVKDAVIAGRSPQIVVTVRSTGADDPCDEVCHQENRSDLQKVFASQLVKISRKHLNNAHQQRPITSARHRPSSEDVTTSSTKLSEEDPPIPSFFPSFHVKSQSFQLTCGGVGGSTNSVVNTNAFGLEQNNTEKIKKNVVSKSDTPFGCSYQPDTRSEKLLPGLFPHCFNMGGGGGCLASLIPDSFNRQDPVKRCTTSNVVAGDPVKGDDVEPNNKIFKFFRANNPFAKRRPETKRNGIPEVITVVISKQPDHTIRSSCCSAIIGDKMEPTSYAQKSTINTCRSFDSSIVRLEETLKIFNLVADVEQKCFFPTHVLKPGSTRHLQHQERTAD